MVERDWILLGFISFIAPFSFGLIMLSMPLKALEVGFTEGTVALIILVSNSLQIFGRPISGYFGDKIGSKKPIILALLFYFSAYTTFYIAGSIYEMLLGAIFLGLGVSFLWNSIFSHVVRMGRGQPQYSIGTMLSIAFSGNVIGISIGGFLVEFFGLNLTFFISMLATSIAFFLSMLLRNVGGGANPSIKTLFSITLRNIKDLYFSINSLAAFPLIRTYGILLLLRAGLSEGLTGLILTMYRVFSIVMQFPSARFYEKILRWRDAINLFALISLLLFTYFASIHMLIPSIVALVIYSMASNLLPTGQLTKATTENMRYASTGAGGFGAGLSTLRITYTSLSSSAGYYAETYLGDIYPPAFAMYIPVIFFITLSTINILSKKL